MNAGARPSQLLDVWRRDDLAANVADMWADGHLFEDRVTTLHPKGSRIADLVQKDNVTSASEALRIVERELLAKGNAEIWAVTDAKLAARRVLKICEEESVMEEVEARRAMGWEGQNNHHDLDAWARDRNCGCDHHPGSSRDSRALGPGSCEWEQANCTHLASVH